MIVVPGYRIDETIYESPLTRVCRARRDQDLKRVVIKQLRRAYPDPEEAARIRREHQLISLVDSQGIPKPVELVRIGNSYALVLEAPDALSVDQQNIFGKVGISEFLDFAQRVVSHLADIHAARIVHMDLSPSNLLWNRKSGSAYIVDFNISRRLVADCNSIPNSGHMLGTMAYMSPEQTGRMNRSIDTRSDIYCLGASLYHLLTGRLPFDCDDSLEMVHAHIALHAEPAHKLDPSIPGCVSAVLTKMLAKKAEDRYQTARGLSVDLRRCLEIVEAGTPDPSPDPSFPLGSEDVSPDFQLTEQLYGRDKEMQLLSGALQRVCAEPCCEFVLVAGGPGSGKSTLVQELNAPVVAREGYFISGNFGEGENRPYASFIEAFSELVQHLLTAGGKRMLSWRERLLAALETNGRVIVDLIPDLELIIGQQPEVPELPPAEAQNRFNYTFMRLIRALCSPQRPMVIFLDDLQWADPGSVQLIELIMTDPDMCHLLLLGTYREDEVGPWHSLTGLLERLKRDRCPATTVSLESLDASDTALLLEDSFKFDSSTAKALASICVTKTNGNPFFLAQFLKSLHQHKTLKFDLKSGCWQCDLADIEAMDITDNVVELIVAKIHRLSSGTQEVLKTAACIGGWFSAALLARTLTTSEEAMLGSLHEALLEGLVMVSSGAIVDQEEEQEGEDTVPVTTRSYRFTHDRVRQAPYSLLDTEEKARTHLSIGRCLLSGLEDSQTFDVFDVVTHLNIGLEYIEDGQERLNVARLNLRAAQQSRRSLAIRSALGYVERGLALLPDDCWESLYDVVLDLHVTGLESAQLALDRELLEQYGQTLYKKARLVTDKVRVHEARLSLYTREVKLAEAIDEGIAGLALLGEKLPRKPGIPSILAAYMKTRKALKGVTPEDLLNLPDMQEERCHAIMRIILRVSEACYWSEPNLVPHLAFKAVQLSVKHGICSVAPWGVIGFAFVVGGPFKKLEEGLRWARGALLLHQRVQSENINPHVAFLYNMFFRHLVSPLRDALPEAEDGYHAAMKVGAPGAAASCRHMWAVAKLWGTNDLSAILEGLEENTGIMSRLNHDWYYQMSLDLRLAASRLVDGAIPVDLATGEPFDGERYVEISILNNDKSALAMHHTSMMAVCCILGEFAEAETHAASSSEHQEAVAASLYEGLQRYYSAVSALCAGYERGDSSGSAVRLARKQLGCLKKWERHSPENHKARCLILEALLARARGNISNAVCLLEEALTAASTHDQLVEEAFTLELLARTMEDAGSMRTAASYRFEAYYAYKRYGAQAKLERLLAAHPELATQLEEARQASVSPLRTTKTVTKTTTGSRTGGDLDLESVLKATRAISGEIVLESLIRNMMTIVVENAGAQRGVLVLLDGTTWNVEAVADVGNPQPLAVRSVELGRANAETPVVPESMIHFIINTSKDLVLDDATDSGEFVHDSYVKQVKPRSVMCAPIAYRGALSGVIYLENNSTTHAFTSDRTRMVRVLCSQVAVSMENARLFRGKEELIAAYQRFVPQEFLSHLGKKSIVDVQLGDQVEKEMTILFSDIRGFTAISEKMDPEENFAFVNSYLSAMEPVIRQHHGFIDKYIGDAIMALFPTDADDAVRGAIEMVKELRSYNEQRVSKGAVPVRIGIGLNTGLLMLGTVGGSQRMDGTVISDAVNQASRVEEMTKTFGAAVLAAEETLERLQDRTIYGHRKVGTAAVKGKTRPVTVYEFFDGDPVEVATGKKNTSGEFARALRLYEDGDLSQAEELFKSVCLTNPEDRVAQVYVSYCRLG